MTNPRQNPLRLDSETMRELGYQAVDMIVDYFHTVEQQAVVPSRQGRDNTQELPAFRDTGRPLEDLIDLAQREVFSDCMNLIHPRFFAYIPGPSNYLSAVADLLVSGHNVFAGVTPHNQGARRIEEMTIRWLCDLCQMPADAGGLFVSGGSVAILTGLAAGRHRILQDDISMAMVYCSTQTHSSVEKALHLLGFKSDQLRLIDTDEDFKVDLKAMASAIESDIAKGLKPFCIVANAGTTNTGAVDPLAALGQLAEQHGMWFHVDAAYGGGALLSSRCAAQFQGLGQADSISFDPHKWLFQAYENACVLVKDPNALRDTFRRVPDYMRDTDTPDQEPNYRDMSPQVTRAFKAFKLWFSLQGYGVQAFRQAVEHGLEMARYFETTLRAREKWQVVTPATLGIVTFRYLFSGSDQEQDDKNQNLIQAANADGYAFFSSTKIHGREVNRACPINPALTRGDIETTVDRLERLALTVSS